MDGHQRGQDQQPGHRRNKKAAFNYFFERCEAGMVPGGWKSVKALRAGKAQLTDGYVVIPWRRAVRHWLSDQSVGHGQHPSAA